MRLALRNRAAGLCLADLRSAGRHGGIAALRAFADAADANGVARDLDARHVAGLTGPGEPFRPVPGGGVELPEDPVRDLEALRARIPAFEAALAEVRAGAGPEPDVDGDARLRWTLRAASALWAAGLFFEVHEILEEAWQPAEPPLRTFLQGLIQAAVAFHHLDAGNLRGASSLLAEGTAKLRGFRPEAWGVELRGFVSGLDRCAHRLGHMREAVDRGVTPPEPLPPPPLVAG